MSRAGAIQPAPLTRATATICRAGAASRALALTREGTPRKRLNKNEGIPADDAHGKALRDDWLANGWCSSTPRNSPRSTPSARCPTRSFPRGRAARSTRSRRLLLLAAAQLTRMFNQHGECDHPEIAGAARRALTEDSSPTPLAERLGTRLMHILVDEFQDTSRDQYELLRTLTQDWSSGDGRTLFLVGDPMQSIYGFRNAEVGRFSTVRAAGLARSAAARRWSCAAISVRRRRWCTGATKCSRACFPTRTTCAAAPCVTWRAWPARTQLEGAPRIYRVEARLRPHGEADGGGRSDRRN